MGKKVLTRTELCRMFDHTNLRPDARKKELEKLCREARENHCAMVAVNSYPVSYCREFLKGSDVHVGAAIAFPLGQTSVEAKVFEAADAIKRGADEIDYVLNISELKSGNIRYITEEMKRMKAVCHEKNVILKVIFENCYLTQDEIAVAASIAADVEPDFIKTSTGFGAWGAKEADVRLMKGIVGEKVKVKAAGGIRSWETCRQMIEAGAERIGTSNTLKILEEFESESLKRLEKN